MFSISSDNIFCNKTFFRLGFFLNPNKTMEAKFKFFTFKVSSSYIHIVTFTRRHVILSFPPVQIYCSRVFFITIIDTHYSQHSDSFLNIHTTTLKYIFTSSVRHPTSIFWERSFSVYNPLFLSPSLATPFPKFSFLDQYSSLS